MWGGGAGMLILKQKVPRLVRKKKGNIKRNQCGDELKVAGAQSGGGGTQIHAYRSPVAS